MDVLSVGGVAVTQLNSTLRRNYTVPESVLDAIKQGQWDFEPENIENDDYDSTVALPGTTEKISILAERAQDGLPLWHPADRRSYDDSEEALV